jgi:hypothetical protein
MDALLPAGNYHDGQGSLFIILVACERAGILPSQGQVIHTDQEKIREFARVFSFCISGACGLSAENHRAKIIP